LSGADIPDYRFSYSIDSSRYFLFAEAGQKDKEFKKFHYTIFSNTLEKAFDNNVELPFESRFISIQSIMLDNGNHVFVEYRHYEKELGPELIADEDARTPVYETVLAQFNENDKQPYEIKLNVNDGFLHSTRIALNAATGKLNIAGTYRATKKGKVKGIFYCEYDAVAKTVTNLKSNEIPAELLTLFHKDEVGSDGGKDPGISGNFKAQRLSARGNGSIDFSLEYNSTVEGNENIGGKSYSFSQKFSKDILNVNIDKKGIMIFTRIPKNQLSGNRDFLSNFSFYYGKNLVFIYNDNKKNGERDLNKAPEKIEDSYRTSVLMAAIVNEKGEVQRKIIYDHSEDKFATMPKSIQPITATSFFALRKKVGSFVEIEHSKIGVMSVK
jgi:hypothetical protein